MKNETAVFGGGCFWCTEAIFKMVKGVTSVTPGYAGGHAESPNYYQVCSGTTGHAEVIKVEFDADVIKYEDLLEVFWQAHDPTTKNRQGNDIGTQYRSIILYQDPHTEDEGRGIFSESKCQRAVQETRWSLKLNLLKYFMKLKSITGIILRTIPISLIAGRSSHPKLLIFWKKTKIR